MANTDGVNIVISGDSSQAVNEVEKVTKAIDGVKGTNVKITADASQAIDESGKVSSAMENIDDVNTVRQLLLNSIKFLLLKRHLMTLVLTLRLIARKPLMRLINLRTLKRL